MTSSFESRFGLYMSRSPMSAGFGAFGLFGQKQRCQIVLVDRVQLSRQRRPAHESSLPAPPAPPDGAVSSRPPPWRSHRRRPPAAPSSPRADRGCQARGKTADRCERTRGPPRSVRPGHRSWPPSWRSGRRSVRPRPAGSPSFFTSARAPLDLRAVREHQLQHVDVGRGRGAIERRAVDLRAAAQRRRVHLPRRTACSDRRQSSSDLTNSSDVSLLG